MQRDLVLVAEMIAAAEKAVGIVGVLDAADLEAD